MALQATASERSKDPAHRPQSHLSETNHDHTRGILKVRRRPDAYERRCELGRLHRLAMYVRTSAGGAEGAQLQITRTN